MEAEERPRLPFASAPSPSLAEPVNPECTDAPNLIGGSVQSSLAECANLSLYTETTPETTSQSTNNNNEPAAPSSLSSVLIEEKTEDDFQAEPPLQTEAETETPPNMDLNSLCEEHGIQFATLCAVLDLYEKAAGEWPDAGGIQAIVIWMAVHGTELVRESVGELQTAILTRQIQTNPLRYLGGIIKHKSAEVEDEQDRATGGAGATPFPTNMPM